MQCSMDSAIFKKLDKMYPCLEKKSNCEKLVKVMNNLRASLFLPFLTNVKILQ